MITKHKWLVMALVAAVGFFIDWYTKYLADSRLTMGVPVPVVGEYLQFLLVYNKGALFGFNPQRWLPWFPVNQFFLFFSFLAMAFLIFYYRSLKKNEPVLHWGLAVVMPGALGNMLDRIIHPQKGVIDFVKIGVSEDLYWPIFNMADVYVTIGVGLILLSYFLEGRKEGKALSGDTGKQDSVPENEESDVSSR